MSWIMVLGIPCVTYTLMELLRVGATPANSPTGEAPGLSSGGVVDPETGQDVEIQVDRRVRHDPEKAVG